MMSVVTSLSFLILLIWLLSLWWLWLKAHQFCFSFQKTSLIDFMYCFIDSFIYVCSIFIIWFLPFLVHLGIRQWGSIFKNENITLVPKTVLKPPSLPPSRSHTWAVSPGPKVPHLPPGSSSSLSQVWAMLPLSPLGFGHSSSSAQTTLPQVCGQRSCWPSQRPVSISIKLIQVPMEHAMGKVLESSKLIKSRSSVNECCYLLY